jgi:hypothetical protein
MTAAQCLGEALAADRRRGVPFEEAWAPTRARTLEDERLAFERRCWHAAFGATREAWAAA